MTTTTTSPHWPKCFFLSLSLFFRSLCSSLPFPVSDKKKDISRFLRYFFFVSRSVYTIHKYRLLLYLTFWWINISSFKFCAEEEEFCAHTHQPREKKKLNNNKQIEFIHCVLTEECAFLFFFRVDDLDGNGVVGVFIVYILLLSVHITT